ncbi:hypothetical protein BU26DRAFT_132684 [Trematosphaeria pertusa]|uniref:Uncharacterized protein n=1 Tax=Trematosphaeria pertusa TaxID=390896 RepID=A0A6A6HYB0_9PLEO|nr:uncharacterized protein BU26DRAFT_132684 [Trematosphaeria pertusa]KAF2242768.1 hypothetical protein BU26DRAFT_132684 [Trematosphaeria pertusa]
MDAAHDHHQQQQLPPSPPPSPPTTRRRPKKDADPFFDLGHARTPLPSPSPPASPSNERDEPQEYLITRLILTPLYFTSFLISLFLVNRSDRARRASSASRTSTVFSYLWPSAWIDPEPYQDPVDTTWDRRDSAPHVEPHAAISPRQAEDKGKRKRKSWHLHRNIRKVARLEISDAFEMRGRVMLGIVGSLVGVAVGGCAVVVEISISTSQQKD